MSVTEISSDALIPIDQHFRISAGPGAGKTHWLVGHIENVLQNSDRLGNYKKAACITYTNVAVDTILKRLDFVADRVEVSTIHGFLYKHILKPYMSFIAAEHGFNVKRMDGHDDHIISRKRIVDWIKTHPNIASFRHPYTLNQMILLDNNLSGIGNWLTSLHYELRGAEIEMVTDNSAAFYMDGTSRRNLSKVACLDKLSPDLLGYKKTFWAQGTLHHDDVLYFSFLLLKKYPFILTLLRAKFPYFFIDEFQDTSPIQSAIIKLIGAKDTLIGIIGDVAQSIYSFQGALPSLFTDFDLPEIAEYLIRDNRRSSNQIVTFLNAIRPAMIQHPVRAVDLMPVTLLVGEMGKGYEHVQTVCGIGTFTALSRNNITSNILRRQSSSHPPINLIAEWSNKESNSDRRRTILNAASAVEFARQKRFKDAIVLMGKNLFHIKDKTERKKAALNQLVDLLSDYDRYRAEPMFRFYELVKAVVAPAMPAVSRGAARMFYDGYSYDQIADCINIPEDDSLSRTIHKAKGDEFDNVLVVLKKEADLTFVTNPDLSLEEQRVNYVAVSRARERLFISIPSLDAVKEASLSGRFDIVQV
ncbi:ATP-dependent helicase [Pedobacter sp. UYP1]|uniref:ATP-dependent helicase n=1 Tax=Pedobacter sp. UYP1 TaxID=1756396 RepID=UPI0033976527